MKGIRNCSGLHALFMIPFSLGIYLFLSHPVQNRILPHIVTLLKAMEITHINIYLVSTISMTMILLWLIILCLLTKQTEILRLKRNNLLTGFKLGWYVLLYSIVYIMICYQDYAGYQSSSKIITSMIYYILVAVCEEIVFRGLIQKNAFEYIEQKYNSIVLSEYTSVLISSLFFTVVHFSNAGSVSTKAVMIQVIGAFVYGFLFGIITFKTQNLLSAILLHAINDISSAYAVIILKTGKTAADVINSYGFAELLAMIPVVICIIWMFREDYDSVSRN